MMSNIWKRGSGKAHLRLCPTSLSTFGNAANRPADANMTDNLFLLLLGDLALSAIFSRKINIS